MNRRSFQIGPGAASLLLIAVVLCMGVLGALSLVSARGDAQLSMRSIRMAESAATLNSYAEEELMQLDQVLVRLSERVEDDDAYLAELGMRLPDEMEMDGRTIRWEEAAADGRRVTCAVEVAPLGEFPRARWTDHRLWTQLDEDLSDQFLLLPQ